MKYRKSLFVILACILLLSGCGQKTNNGTKKELTETINDDEYPMVVPYKSSDARQVHVEYNRGYADINAVGKGLIQYSKKVFSTDDYYLQDGQVLNRDRLAIGTYYGDDTGILGFKSEKNNYGLNPAKGSSLSIGNGKKITCGNKTIPVLDVFELDFYKSLDEKAPIKGISFAIVLNPKIEDANGKKVTISKDKLREYGENAANSLISYVKTLPQIENDMDFCVMLYEADSSDSSLPGSVMAYGSGKKEISNYTNVNESWVLFPSDEAEKKASGVNADFLRLSDSLHGFLPNDTAIVGKGRVSDGVVRELNIDISAQVKSYSECIALCQYVKQEIGEFNNQEYNIVIDVKNNNDTFAMIERKANSKDVTVILK